MWKHFLNLAKDTKRFAGNQDLGTPLLGAFLIILILGWGMVFIYAVHAALPLNAVSLPLEESITPQMWIPEGWKFFTRSPREDVINGFIRGPDGNWVSALRGVNGSPSNLFGIKRTTRAQGIEIGLLITAVSQSAWQQCKEELETCAEKAPLDTTLRNVTPNPTLCGEVALTKQPPVPWAWSRSGKKITMPSKVVRINVKC